MQSFIASNIFFLQAKDKTERHKRNAVNKLKEEWNDILVENMERRIYIKFPSKNTHSGHVMGEVSYMSYVL